jgi:hypothetical protein
LPADAGLPAAVAVYSTRADLLAHERGADREGRARIAAVVAVYVDNTTCL